MTDLLARLRSLKKTSSKVRSSKSWDGSSTRRVNRHRKTLNSASLPVAKPAGQVTVRSVDLDAGTWARDDGFDSLPKLFETRRLRRAIT